MMYANILYDLLQSSGFVADGDSDNEFLHPQYPNSGTLSFGTGSTISTVNSKTKQKVG